MRLHQKKPQGADKERDHWTYEEEIEAKIKDQDCKKEVEDKKEGSIQGEMKDEKEDETKESKEAKKN